MDEKDETTGLGASAQADGDHGGETTNEPQTEAPGTTETPASDQAKDESEG